MAELQYSKQAIKYLRRMQRYHAQKMRQALQKVAAGSVEGLNIKQMSHPDTYRLRLGNYRAVYTFRNQRESIVVARIGIRGDFYK